MVLHSFAQETRSSDARLAVIPGIAAIHNSRVSSTESYCVSCKAAVHAFKPNGVWWFFYRAACVQAWKQGVQMHASIYQREP